MMARDEGFAIADVDTSLFDDAKVKRLWRLVQPDAALMATAMTLFEAVRLASWRAGQRVPAEDAAPIWMPDPAPAIEALVGVGLLDTDGLIPPKTWSSWYEAAFARRERSRYQWRERQARRRARDVDVTGPSREPSVPSVPSARPHTPPRAYEAPPPDFVREGLPHLAFAAAVVEVGEHITGRGILAAGDKQLTELDRLVERHGIDDVVASMRLVAGDGRLEWRQLVWAAMKQLEPIPDRVKPEDARRREQDALVARLETRS